jgi:hypothetical protein
MSDEELLEAWKSGELVVVEHAIMPKELRDALDSYKDLIKVVREAGLDDPERTI